MGSGSGIMAALAIAVVSQFSIAMLRTAPGEYGNSDYGASATMAERTNAAGSDAGNGGGGTPASNRRVKIGGTFVAA